MKYFNKNLLFSVLISTLLQACNSNSSKLMPGNYDGENLELGIYSIKILNDNMLSIKTKFNKSNQAPYIFKDGKIEFRLGQDNVIATYREDQKSIYINGAKYTRGNLKLVIPIENIKSDKKILLEIKQIEDSCNSEPSENLDQCMIANGIGCCKRLNTNQ